MERDTAVYDFVLMDAFLCEDTLGHFFTWEALTAMRRWLAPGGFLAINYTSLPNGEDARSVARRLRAVFPHLKA